MKRFGLALYFFIFSISSSMAQQLIVEPSADSSWPVDLSWWKRNNLRVMQCNLPAYEAGLNVDLLIEDLQKFSVNTLIINGGGIMAFYPTELDFQYTNPYMQPNMLGDVIEKCHKNNIRVITRFDFSRFHESIFDKHPDWAYISPNGERIINDDMYVASINAPYVQEKSIEIVKELINKYPVDGIFINMPGYSTRNVYEDLYFGIDQNAFDRKRFSDFSGGLSIPSKEDPGDPVFMKYQDFKKYTADDWMQKIHKAVKVHNPDIAICTYMEKYVDIIRHESQTNSLPYWPYMSYDNVTNTSCSQPNHIVSNASIQQISFRSRFNAIEPEETAIRLYENLAAGSGLDMSLMGDFRQYEDERNFKTWEKIYGLHKKYEPYFGKYASAAEICVISPAYWPGGVSGQEYKGIQLMLKEAHLQYDIIHFEQIATLREKIEKYKLIIIPDIPNLSDSSITVLSQACSNGTAIIATNKTLHDKPEALLNLFGAKIIETQEDGFGYYLSPDNKELFTLFRQQTLLFWRYNLGFYDLSNADDQYLPIYTPGRPGPPEKTGGHEPTGFFAMGAKKHVKGKAAILPLNLGRLYFIHGYEQHKNILLDIISWIFPTGYDLVQTNAPERVEVVLQKFTENVAQNVGLPNDEDGLMLHLTNLTGFSGNTYFKPIPIPDIQFKIKCTFPPRAIYSMTTGVTVPHNWREGYLEFSIPRLNDFEGLVIKKQI
ncbi:MAG: family 10 glycosylhydrolase [Saprospiraceae bacterium]|nr:family 10 glycosylhydrolase [Saprospiraceae bacterium]